MRWRTRFDVRLDGSDVRHHFVKPSGLSYGMEFEKAMACLEMRMAPSSFDAWPVADQARVMAALRLKGRMEAALWEKQSSEAKRNSGRKGDRIK